DESRIETLDHLLKTWLELISKAFADVSVLVGLSDALREGLSNGAALVFRTFVEAKLTECVRSQQSLSDGAPESSFSTEYAESQTQLLALLGREQPAATATFLGTTLRQLFDQFSTLLSHRQSCSEGLSEGLWFVLSVASHFVADGSESERNAIPNSIVTHALRWEREFPDDEPAQERSNEVLALIQLVMKCALDTVPLAPSGLVSPGVCQALLMFLRHACGAYLFPDDSLLMDFSNVFTSAFGGGVALGDAALQATVGCLTTFPYDQDVTKAASALLGALAEKPREFGEWVATHPHFTFLVQLASGNANGVELPGVVKGRVFGFLVSVCPIERVTSAVVTPIATSLGNVLYRAGQTPAGQLLDIGSVVSAVDSLAGAFTALRTEEQTKTVFASLAPLVDVSATILQHHSSHKPLLTSILRMMNTIVVSCSFLASSSFIHVVEIGLVCIRVTKAAMDESRANAARLQNEAASLEEDERVDVLSAAATFVESVATWGLLDMNCDDGFDAQGASGPDLIADLSVQGLLVVLTYCDEHVLAIPQLRDTVFNLLQEVSSTYKARFLSASPLEANALLAATDFALASNVPSLNRSGYKVMEAIATYCCQNDIQGFELLVKFTRSVATVLATADVDSSVFPSVAAALFALGGACGPDNVVAVIYEVFSTSPLLAWPFQALQKLLTSTNFRTHSRDLRSKFVRDVEAVLLMVRGTKIS
ncbi:GPI-anchored surface protein, putative, partial [Bodo saltans]